MFRFSVQASYKIVIRTEPQAPEAAAAAVNADLNQVQEAATIGLLVAPTLPRMPDFAAKIRSPWLILHLLLQRVSCGSMNACELKGSG